MPKLGNTAVLPLVKNVVQLWSCLHNYPTCLPPSNMFLSNNGITFSGDWKAKHAQCAQERTTIRTKKGWMQKQALLS